MEFKRRSATAAAAAAADDDDDDDDSGFITSSTKYDGVNGRLQRVNCRLEILFDEQCFNMQLVAVSDSSQQTLSTPTTTLYIMYVLRPSVYCISTAYSRLRVVMSNF